MSAFVGLLLRLSSLTLLAVFFAGVSPLGHAQTVKPNFAECSADSAGQLNCTAFIGTCSGSAYSKSCVGGGGQAFCTKSTTGIVSCQPSSGTKCYTEYGTAKCYKAVQGSPPLITALAPSFSFTQAVNVASVTKSEAFDTANTSTSYTIYGFTITGDFQIVSTSGACITGSALSECRVNFKATPRLPGTRYGTLSMATSVGTIAVPLTVTGVGMANTSATDKNAAHARVIRVAPANPQAMRAVVALVKGQSNNGLKADVCTAPGTSPDSGRAAGNTSGTGDDDSNTGPEPELPGDSDQPPGQDDNGGPVPMLPLPLSMPTYDQLLGAHNKSLRVTDTTRLPHTANSHLVALGANLGIGNETRSQSDLETYFPAPLTFVRTYNSYGFSSANAVRQDVGIGWRSSWDRAIVLDGTGQTATAYRSTGQAYVYGLNASTGAWATTGDVAGALVSSKDANGYTIGWTLTLPDGTAESYDAWGRLVTVTLLQGTSYSVGYDSAGRLQSVRNSYARQLSFAYDANGRLNTMTDPAGSLTTYGYDARGRLTKVTYPDNRTLQYIYENASFPFALTGTVDGSGTRVATYAYDSTGRIASTQLAGSVGGGSFTYPSGATAKFTDALSTVWNKTFAGSQSAYQLVNESVSCAQCPSTSSQITYDGNGSISVYTNKAGITTQYFYDGSNRPFSIFEAVGRPEQRVTDIRWSPAFNLPVTITQGNRSTAYTYDAGARVTGISVTSGGETHSTTYSYDSQGNVVQIDGPRTDLSDVTAYAYDDLGNLTSVTNPQGRVTRYSQYNALGQAGRIDYPDGLFSIKTYDPRGRILTSTLAGGAVTYTYDANGNASTAVYGDGSSIAWIYDSAQRLTGINNSHGEQIRYTLDGAGNRTRTDTYDSAGTVTSTKRAVYDGLSRITQSIDANNNVTHYYYDSSGNVTRVTDPLNNNTYFTYDGLNRPTVIQDPLSHYFQFGYDPADHITSVSDSNNNVTQYTYNGFGYKTQEASPDAGTSTFTFDFAGNTLSKYDARGGTATMSYDSLGRLYRTTYSDGQSIALTFDVGTSGIGRLATMTDPSGTTTYTYDANGRVATKNQVTQGVSLQVKYGRDTLGRVTSVTYPSGKVLGIAYDNDRPVSMTWDGVTVISGIQYFPFGVPESWLFGGVTEYTRYIDTNGRIYKYLTPTGSRSLTYDANSRITQLTEAPSNRTQTFSYDAAGRLLSFTGFTSAGASESRSYTYDANGNRLSATVNGLTATYSYSPGTNRLASVSGLYTNTYDAAGNLLSNGKLTHTYDARGRLVKSVVNESQIALTNFYNGFGQRVNQQNNGASGGIVWLYDESGKILGQYSSVGAPLQEFVWLGSTPLAVAGSLPITCQTPPCTTYGIGYIWSDYLNTPRAITNLSGTPIWQWDSAPFGDDDANENPSALGSFAFNLRFPGQYVDQVITLNDNGTRNYDALLGRYIESDPIGMQGGFNSYAYSSNNPVSLTDPTGTQVAIYAGLEIGSFVCGPVCAVTGGVISVGLTYLVGRWSESVIFARPARESRPIDAPPGTVPIDQSGLGREDIHDIKDPNVGIGAAPRDWVGITPDGRVISTNPDGTANDHGPADDYTKRPTGLCGP